MKELAESWLLEWFTENTDFTEAELRAKMNADCFAEGFLDSMKFIFLVAAAESKFSIRFSQSDFDFTSGTYKTLAGFSEIIKNHIK